MAPRVLLATIMAAGAFAACTSTPTRAPEPEVQQKSPFRVWYTGPTLRAELEHRWASRHAGDEWLVLKLAVASAAPGVTPIPREAVTARAPDGRVYVLVDRPTFRAAASGLAIALDRYDAWGRRSQRFGRSLEPSPDWFFSPQGGLDRSDIIYPSNVRFCTGPLVFRVPGGVQAGSWRLEIATEEGIARIPFAVEPPAR